MIGLQIHGIQQTVSTTGIVRLQRMLRMQWTEACLLATAVSGTNARV